MILKIDVREQEFISLCRKHLDGNATFQKNIKLIVEPLPIGDIILCDDSNNERIVIERKCVKDLAASIKDGRYDEQSYRLNGLPIENHNIIYLVEGDLNKKSSSTMDKNTLYSAMVSLQYYKGFSLMRSFNMEESAFMVCNMANKIVKGELENRKPFYSMKKEDGLGNGSDGENVQKPYCEVIKKVKKENITPENIGEIMLCQIPGISSTSAVEIMKQFHSLPLLIEKLKENPGCLEKLSYVNSKNQVRKMNKTIVENVKKFLSV